MCTRYALAISILKRREQNTDWRLQKFEFTPEGISKRAVATIDFYKEVKPLRSPINRAFLQLI